MKKHFTSFFLLSVLFAILAPLSVYGQTAPQEIKLPFTAADLSHLPSQPKFYSIDVSALPENMDISVSSLLLADKKKTTSDIFVSKTNQNPDSKEKSDYASTGSNGNILFIPGKDLKGVKTLYVGIKCGRGQCQSKVTIELTKEIVMEANGERLVETTATLGGAGSAVVRLSVPKVDKASRIVIHVDAIPSKNDQTPTLEVFINKGNSIPYTGNSNDIRRSSWFAGKTIMIDKNDGIFETGVTYTMSLQFTQGSSLSIDARVYPEETPLTGETVLDGLKKNQMNSYVLNIQKERENEDIVIDLRAQEGSPVIYLNCDEKPVTKERYYWRYHIDRSQEIILTKREREKCKTNTIYVSVFGDDDYAIYSLRATIKKANKLFVDKDEQVLGDIFPNEKVSYEIFMPLFAADKVKLNLTYTGSVSYTVINCRFPSDCPGLLPSDMEYQYQEDDTYDFQIPFEFDVKNADNGKGKLITIDPHTGSGCYPIIIQDPIYMEDAMPVCAYKITLSSNDNYPQEYTLSADSEGHDWLFVGIPKASSVMEGSTEYFKVEVPDNNEDIKSVDFQLTEYSGDVIIYISKKVEKPDANSQETKFAHEGRIMFTNRSDLNGTYYVAVEGLVTSSFGLSVNVMGVNDTSLDYALTLRQGVPQKGVLFPKKEHPAQFYKFKLKQAKDWKGAIKLSVNTVRGNVLVGVNNNDVMPMPNAHQWKFNGRDFEIRSDDQDFNPDATYYIGVFVDWKFKTMDDIVYTISYSIKSDQDQGNTTNGTNNQPVQKFHQFLSPLTPYYGKLKKGDYEYFEAFILPKDKKIAIYKQVDVGDIDIFITTDPQNEYPTSETAQITTKGKSTFKDYVELNEGDFTKICGPAGQDSICTFYFSVTPRGNDDSVSYTLTMSREYKPSDSKVATWIPLEDGREIKADINSDASPSLFYFYSSPYNPSVITVNAPGKLVSIYASKTKVEVGTTSKTDFKTVTNEKYEYSSYNNGATNLGVAYLSIPAAENYDTNIISVAVYFWDLDTDKSNTKFTILASSQMTYIYTGTPYFGTVQEGQYMYFFFDVFKDSTTLLISMTQLDDGDPDLVVSTGYDARPTIEQHQFASISKQRTELLEINDLDIYPLTSMANTWVVGVYGRKASTFTLTVLFEDQKMVELAPGQPFEMYMRADSTMNFKYYQAKSTDLDIRVEELSGNITAYIATASVDQEMANALPTATGHTWKIVPSEKSTLRIPANDPKACTNCYYLITLNSTDASKLSVTVAGGNSFSQIQNGLTYSGSLPENGVQKYSFYSSNVDEIALSLSMIGARLDVYVSHNPTVNDTKGNYVWLFELTPSVPSQVFTLKKADYEKYLSLRSEKDRKGINDGTKEVPFENNTFYLYFKNPFYTATNYTFTMATRNSTTVMKHGSKHSLSITAGGTGSLVYYSSEEEEILKVIIEFTVTQDFQFGPDADFDRNIKKGLPLTVYYWNDKATTGLGQQQTVFRDYVTLDNVISTDQGKRKYKVREAYTAVSKIGKFSFELENPFNSIADVQITAYSTQEGTLTLESNSQFTTNLSKGLTENFEVYLADKGAWYFFVHSCTGSLDFSVEENPEKLFQGSSNTKLISDNENALKQVNIEKAVTEYVGLRKSELGGDGTKPAQFTLSSSFFPGEKLFNYELSDSISEPSTSFVFSPHNSVITIDLPRVTFKQPDTDDRIAYLFKVCPYKEKEHENSLNLCQMYEECKTAEIDVKVSSSEKVTGKIERLLPGKYYVHAAAALQHKDKTVRFVPYPISYVTIEKSLSQKVSDMFGAIVLGLSILLIAAVICYKCYGKIKKVGEDRGFELPSFSKRREYGFLGDDL